MKNKYMKFKEKIQTNKFYSNLFKNSFWAFLGDSTASVLNLVVTIILIKLTGNYNYGLLVLAQSYMSIVDTTLNVQCWKSVIQFGQKAIVENDDSKLNSYVLLGTKLDVITAIIGGIVSLLLSPLIGTILNWSTETIICAQIFSITIFSHLSGTSTAILRILDKFHLVAIQKFVTSVIKLITLIIIMIMFKHVSIVTAAIAYCASDIIGNILLVIMAVCTYRKKHKIKDVLKAEKVKEKKEFIKFTFWGTVGMIADIPINYLDVFIISLLGSNMVAVFKVFKQCIAIIKKVTSAIQQAIMPQFSELIARGERERGYKIVKKTRNIILKIMIPVGLLIGLTSPLWLNIIYGKIYAANWYNLLIYLIIEIIALSYTTIHPFYVSLDKAKSESYITLGANVIYIILALIFVKLIGMTGMIIAIAIQCFITIYLKMIGIKKELKLN